MEKQNLQDTVFHIFNRPRAFVAMISAHVLRVVGSLGCSLFYSITSVLPCAGKSYGEFSFAKIVSERSLMQISASYGKVNWKLKVTESNR